MARSSRSPPGEPWQATPITRITGLDFVDPWRVSQAGLDVFLTA